MGKHRAKLQVKMTRSVESKEVEECMVGSPEHEKPKKISTQRIPVQTSRLKLDLDNPRFGLKHVADPIDALTMLAERANLKELWDSISSQGWLELEPMVCIKAPEDGYYTVIEGNRRLAAINLYCPS